MRRMGTISVGTVDNLETGDLFAYEFIGGVQGGRVIAVVYYGFQLTPEQRTYLAKKQNIEIPTNENATIGGATEALLFYHDGKKENHAFIDMNRTMAIFPNPRGL